MKLITTKLNTYTLDQLISGVPKIKSVVFSLQQSADRKGNASEYWEALYFSDMDGTIKYRKQAKKPKAAIVALIKEIRSSKKKK